MPKPSDDLSDKAPENMKEDALVAEKILRRRQEERARSGGYPLGLIGAWAAAFWLWIKLRLKPRGFGHP